MSGSQWDDKDNMVVPHAGTWIEINSQYISVRKILVVPHAGTWIEITELITGADVSKSFPTRERGLKYADCTPLRYPCIVVPHAGTWIEIGQTTTNTNIGQVVPHAGTWIEIDKDMVLNVTARSRSPRGNVD